jgi:hypothetical protein
MTNATLEKLAWILLYSGLLIAVLGWFMLAAAPIAGTVLMVAGGLVAAAGVVLIWLRSRRPR